jgi:hypothetical protein
MSAQVGAVPKCPVCDELMFPYESTFLCLTALAESVDGGGGQWRRVDGSEHPLLPEEQAYLDAHGPPAAEFI